MMTIMIRSSILSLYTLLPLPGNTCVSKLPICFFFISHVGIMTNVNIRMNKTSHLSWAINYICVRDDFSRIHNRIFNRILCFFMYELSFCIICIICIILCYGEVKEILGAFVFALSCPDLIPVLELLWLRYEGNKSFQMIIQFPQFSTRSPLQQGRVIQG